MPPLAPVRLPEHHDDLSPAQIAHLRRAFPIYNPETCDILDLKRDTPCKLSYLQRRANYYQLQWVSMYGMPNRKTSNFYQDWLTYTVGLPFRKIVRLLDCVEWVLLIAEENTQFVDVSYKPRVCRDLDGFIASQVCRDAKAW